MPVARSRSIGEVLALLKTEFPDITISKIRFLESQGLVLPERTRSGYRKFSEDDVARLRYILREQKEHFLPLKVIKERLENRRIPSAREISVITRPMIDVDDENENDVVAVMLSKAELLEATGLTEGQLRELESFGLLKVERSANSFWYGEDAVMIGKLAARFLAFGVEVRHLRIFKTGADREADLYKQMTAGVRMHRKSQARADAAARLEELCRLGESMHAELLRASLRDH